MCDTPPGGYPPAAGRTHAALKAKRGRCDRSCRFGRTAAGGAYRAVARQGLSARRQLRRVRHQLCVVQRGRREGGALPLRRRRHRIQGDAQRGGRLRLARLPAGCRTGPALRLPSSRTLRPGRRATVQPEQAVDRSVCESDRRQLRVAPGAVQLQLRRPRQPQRRRLRAAHAEVGGDQPVLRLGQRPAARPRIRRHRRSTRHTSRD